MIYTLQAINVDDMLEAKETPVIFERFYVCLFWLVNLVDNL